MIPTLVFIVISVKLSSDLLQIYNISRNINPVETGKQYRITDKTCLRDY